MAIVRAVKSGNWSDTTVWNTGNLPTSADDVYSNTFTVTIDVSPTVLSIRNGTATNVTAGGGFVISANEITLTANVIQGGLALLAITINSPAVANIIGNITAGNGNISCLTHSGTGTVNITGDVVGGTTNNSGAYGVSNSSSGTVNITGNVYGTPLPHGGTNYGAYNDSIGTLNITGTVTGGSGSSAAAYGAYNASSGLLTHVGIVQASTAPGIGGVVTGITILSGPFLVSANGTHAVLCPNWKWQNTSPPSTYYQIRTANLSTIRPLYTADYVGGNPAVSDVRKNITYGPSNELTGTCIIPPTQSVYFGVPVDNTTGNLSLTPDVIWNHPISGITSTGSIGERLKNAATISSVGTILSNALR